MDPRAAAVNAFVRDHPEAEVASRTEGRQKRKYVYQHKNLRPGVRFIIPRFPFLPLSTCF
jgi:hypothetical protein